MNKVYMVKYYCRINWPPIETAREKFEERQQISVYGYVETLEVHD